MPKSLDRDDRIVFVLNSDAGKPRDIQPRLIGSVLTLGKQKQLSKALSSTKTEDAEGKLNAAIDAVMVCLSGWENFGREFSREALEDILTINEINEIIDAIVTTFTASGDELKKSASPPTSAAASFANHVAGDAMSFSTNSRESKLSVPPVLGMVVNGVEVDTLN
jgi:hypothetical protein